jgi:flagellar biosynthesis/type III secretory pathway protein FliH
MTVSRVVPLPHDAYTRAIYEGEEKAFMIGKIELETAEKLGEKRGLQQGIQQGMQQGMQKGMQQGMQQGRQQGLNQIVLRLMARRFGDVPAQISARVALLSADELEDLSLALLDFASYADVEAWFNRH